MWIHWIVILFVCVLLLYHIYICVCAYFRCTTGTESFVNPDETTASSTHTVTEDTTPTSKTTPKPMSERTAHTMTGMLKTMSKMTPLDTGIRTLNKLQSVYSGLVPIMHAFVPKHTDNHDIQPVLWSGGVASTFRICELMFVYNINVRPVYMSQPDIDTRSSSTQERITVKALHQYILDNYKKQTTQRLMSVETCDIPLHNTPHNQDIRKHLSFVFNVSDADITNFYVYLVKLRALQDTAHTELSKSPIEIVLPDGGPHYLLREAVDQWGTPFVHTPSVDEPTDEDKRQIHAFTCVKIVSEPSGEDHTLTIDQRRRKHFALWFNHLHFVVPCRNRFYMPHILDTYDLTPIIQRAWSCRHPVLTPYQKVVQKNKIKRNILLHSSFPTGYCQRCESCLQRQEDGITRAPERVLTTENGV